MVITRLDVVNECLASMGEVPLSTLAEPHAYKASALRKLDESNSKLQAPGWWFNTEALSLSPAPVTGHITVPGDCLQWQSGVRDSRLIRGAPMTWVTQRGSRLYDLRERSFTFTQDVVGEITREVPFEELPRVMQDYVVAETVLKFQSNYDADNSKRQELQDAWKLCRVEARSENIRQLQVNFINNNSRLARIKSVNRIQR